MKKYFVVGFLCCVTAALPDYAMQKSDGDNGPNTTEKPYNAWHDLKTMMETAEALQARIDHMTQDGITAEDLRQLKADIQNFSYSPTFLQEFECVNHNLLLLQNLKTMRMDKCTIYNKEVMESFKQSLSLLDESQQFIFRCETLDQKMHDLKDTFGETRVTKRRGNRCDCNKGFRRADDGNCAQQ